MTWLPPQLRFHHTHLAEILLRKGSSNYHRRFVTCVNAEKLDASDAAGLEQRSAANEVAALAMTHHCCPEIHFFYNACRPFRICADFQRIPAQEDLLVHAAVAWFTVGEQEVGHQTVF
eukprot:TRINITY_DN109740_c0_g1_i1.p2 TRINITY_DN109740_c0_g1~~TRINITY_DN109740_c0_g1_i1.p2  ORF type:complete len:118 (+),score=19.54 TRINITY_DN109740_c0_g1_i1:542-895(+)